MFKERILLIGLLPLVFSGVKAAELSLSADQDQERTQVRSFAAKGVVVEVQSDARMVVIRHEAVSNYMAAMTMPFKVKEAGQLAGLRKGDAVAFRLLVNGGESWVDQITNTGTALGSGGETAAGPPAPQFQAALPRHPLMDFKFTNELGRAVSLGDFHGQALAITFFYTRCPLPDFCPRLSKNFQTASRKLLSRDGAPANWHFLSVSFDSEYDSPDVLKAYAQSYRYDSSHWSFLTGPAEKIRDLARQSGATYQLEDGAFNHNFRTLIIDAAGHLQMVFPTGGDLSDAIVDEILKGAVVAPGQPASRDQPP